MIVYRQKVGCVAVGSLRGVSALMNQNMCIFALKVSVPAAFLAGLIKLTDHNLRLNYLVNVMPDATLFGSFNVLVAFALVFRTSQGYTRFDTGSGLLHRMNGALLETSSMVLTLSRHMKVSAKEVTEFRHVFVRLLSLLNLMCLTELSHGTICENKIMDEFSDDLVDIKGIKPEFLQQIFQLDCHVETIFQHIQNLLIDSMLPSVPPPLLTRCFQELSSSMRDFHDAEKLSQVPFPFPFLAVVELLLCLHLAITPFFMATWTSGIVGAASYTFCQVFIVWALYGMAAELDSPFEDNGNSLNTADELEKFNAQLLTVFNTTEMKVAELSADAQLSVPELLKAFNGFQKVHCTDKGALSRSEPRGSFTKKLSRNSERTADGSPKTKDSPTHDVHATASKDFTRVDSVASGVYATASGARHQVLAISKPQNGGAARTMEEPEAVPSVTDREHAAPASSPSVASKQGERPPGAGQSTQLGELPPSWSCLQLECRLEAGGAATGHWATSRAPSEAQDRGMQRFGPGVDVIKVHF